MCVCIHACVHDLLCLNFPEEETKVPELALKDSNPASELEVVLPELEEDMGFYGGRMGFVSLHVTVDYLITSKFYASYVYKYT